ncbi:MAG: UPF0755 protein [Candidatus Midichloriaceae bacterium]|jgi:UPF0755 protein
MKLILKIFLSSIILFLSISYFYIAKQLGEKYEADSASIIIPKNCSIRCISNILSEKNITNTKFAFYYLIFSDFLGKKTLAGEYQINTGETFEEIIKKFRYGKVIVHKITIPEGFTTQQIINLLQFQNNITNDISATDIYPEGAFFPTTYQYLYGTTATQLLSKMSNEMEKVVNTEWEHRDISIYKYKNINEAMIIASIIEKEAVFENEKNIIASVYINRLLKNMLLQADPTVIYGISKWNDFNRKLYYKDLKIRSLYNTYIYRGLPPTPICNPGKSSIHAAMHPIHTDFLYFVANKDGSHVFSKTYQNHLKNIKHINKNNANNLGKIQK